MTQGMSGRRTVHGRMTSEIVNDKEVSRSLELGEMCSETSLPRWTGTDGVRFVSPTETREHDEVDRRITNSNRL